jgi:hypothetical protein
LSRRKPPSDSARTRKRKIEATLKRRALKAIGSISLKVCLTTAKFIPQMATVRRMRRSVAEKRRELVFCNVHSQRLY